MTVVDHYPLGSVELVLPDRNGLTDVSIPAHELRHFTAPVITVICMHGDSITVITGLSTYSERSIIGVMEEQTRDQQIGYGGLVRRKRLARKPKMSQEALAKEVGTDRTHINKIERGKITFPSTDLAGKINQVLEITGDEMMDSLRELPGFQENPGPIKPHGVPHWIFDADEELAGHLIGLTLTLKPRQVETIRRLFALADRIRSARSVVDVEPAPGVIAEPPPAYDPNDPRVELATVLRELPEDAVDSLLTLALWWERQVKQRVIAGEEDESIPATFYPDATDGLRQW